MRPKANQLQKSQKASHALAHRIYIFNHLQICNHVQKGLSIECRCLAFSDQALWWRDWQEFGCSGVILENVLSASACKHDHESCSALDANLLST